MDENTNMLQGDNNSMLNINKKRVSSRKTSERYDTILGCSNSLGGTKMSRVTVLTDKWRALNADIFDMKVKAK